MALTLATNCGFVTALSSADPVATALTFDTRAISLKHVCPANVNKVTKVRVWVDNATEAADIEVGLYSDDGAIEPNLLLFSETFAKGTTSGWKELTLATAWDVTPGTTYWLAAQCDDTTTTTNMDLAASGGSGYAYKNTQTALPANWGASSATDTDGLAAIQALVEQVGGGGGGGDTAADGAFIGAARVTKQLAHRVRVIR